jgi:hypothetical protein
MLHREAKAFRRRAAPFGRYLRMIIEYRFGPSYIPQSSSCRGLAQGAKLRVRACS